MVTDCSHGSSPPLVGPTRNTGGVKYEDLVSYRSFDIIPSPKCLEHLVQFSEDELCAHSISFPHCIAEQ
jgi:hypothetical protein